MLGYVGEGFLEGRVLFILLGFSCRHKTPIDQRIWIRGTLLLLGVRLFKPDNSIHQNSGQAVNLIIPRL